MKVKLLRTTVNIFCLLIALFSLETSAQNVFSGEPVQWVGRPNGYSTIPYNLDYRTLGYRKVSTTASNPFDGRGQWSTSISVQSSGGNISPDNMPGGGGAGWLLISGPGGNRFQNKWNFNGVGQGALNSINGVTKQGGGQDMGLNMGTPGWYTFNMRDAGYVNSEFYVGYTAAPPVSVTRSGQYFSGGFPVIPITTGATPSSGENIYVRYSIGNNDFSLSTSVVQATGSGTSWTATLPQICGSTVYYYVYSSTRTLSQISTDSESDRSLAAIRYDDNFGSNYFFSVAAPSTAAVLSGGATICPGNSTNLQVAITGGVSPYTVVLSDGTTVTNYSSGTDIPVSPASDTNYTITSVTSDNGCTGTGNSGSASVIVSPNVTYYADSDGDGFGNPGASQTVCTGAPFGYVLDSTDCNDNQIQYLDADGDGFGSITKVACGVFNSGDCNDNQLQYHDSDGDTFGSNITVACGVTNNSDCNDNQIQYLDADADGFGSTTQVACGVFNSADCNDNQLQYQDSDGDTFGSNITVACGVTNNSDCNDNQIQYLDADADGFGSTTQVACGVFNSADCNDNQLQYQDADNDTFGSNIIVACGVTNNSDCNDNQLQYIDADADGFGSTTQVACGVFNSADCNDNQLQYQDADNDTFGSNIVVACGVTNNTDCNDNQIQYLDADADGFGSTTQVACGVFNSADCNDNQLQYQDSDNDTFGSNVLVACGVTNNTDCNDNQIQYLDADGDSFGSTIQVACGVFNSADCNDNQLQYQDSDNDTFGSNVIVACGVTNNTDCNDNQIQYLDADGDSFGSTIQVACGVFNSADCNDNQLQYQDSDNDTFGSNVIVACGVTNNTDCNDNQIQYLDADGDSFGSTTQVACGVFNSADCNDNQLQYQDSDGDTFGSNVLVACGVTNNSDCNDGQTLYVDADGDGLGSDTLTPCTGVTNSDDCDDTNFLIGVGGATYYQDLDGDTYGNPAVSVTNCIAPVGYVTNNTDCNDNNAGAHPGATEIGYNLIDDDCDGLIDEGFPPKVTVIQSAMCNTTLAAIDSQLTANLVAGAQGYQWRITNTATNAIQTLDTPLRTMKLTQLATYAFNTTYKVEVAVYFAGFLQPYTPSNCTVTTPEATTKLTNCGQTLTNINDVIYANLVPFANGYKFKIIDPLNGLNTQEIPRTTRDFKMNMVTAFLPQYGKTYNIQVSVRNTNGSYMSYGTTCQVTTPVFPTSSLQDSQCDNYLVPTNSTPIYAISNPTAIKYAFQLSGATLALPVEVVKSVRTFTLNDFTGLTSGATYNVKVRLIFNLTDQPGPYGKTCTIVAPGLARVIAEVNPFTAVAYPNPFTDNFSIDLTTSVKGMITVKAFDMTGRLLETTTAEASEMQSLKIGDRYPAGVYNVIVSQGDHAKTLRLIKR